MGEAARLHRIPVRFGHDKGLAIGTNAKAQKFLCLFHAPRFQLLQDGFG